MLSKNANNKKCAPKFVFFNEKKSKIIFDVENWCYQKKLITKNVLLNSYSSMKKKIRKIRMISDVETWVWKSNLGTFWHLPITPIHKIQWFH